jgi:hypothetical protein
MKQSYYNQQQSEDAKKGEHVILANAQYYGSHIDTLGG